MSGVKGSRTRNWATVTYLELDELLVFLDNLKIDYMISPIHDLDVDPGGQKKKPHRHVLLLYSSVKSEDQVRDNIKDFGVGLEKVNSLRGYARYLCHLDNPEKVRYSEGDVITSGPAVDYMGIVSLPTDKYDAIAAMMDFVDREQIFSFAGLMRYAKDNQQIWFRLLCDSCAVIMREYIKSATWERTKGDDI